MADIHPPAKQRVALLGLVEALGCRDASLRKDECGDPRIVGKLGHIYAVPGGFQLYFRGAPEFEELTSSQSWTWGKKALAFAKVTNDGDGEGMLFLDRLPTAAEAEIIRAKLVIAKKREVSEAELERLRSQGFRPRSADDGSASEPASGDAGGQGQREAAP
jgi:hypothetical protein